jgi:hypothetical protein
VFVAAINATITVGMTQTDSTILVSEGASTLVAVNTTHVTPIAVNVRVQFCFSVAAASLGEV